MLSLHFPKEKFRKFCFQQDIFIQGPAHYWAHKVENLEVFLAQDVLGIGIWVNGLFGGELEEASLRVENLLGEFCEEFFEEAAIVDAFLDVAVLVVE